MASVQDRPQICFLLLQNAIARAMFHRPYGALVGKNRVKADRALSNLLTSLLSVVPDFYESSRQKIGFRPRLDDSLKTKKEKNRK